MKIFVPEDIHGALRALEQCFERCGFALANDTLIQLGDIADGYPDVAECVELLLKVQNLVSIRGIMMTVSTNLSILISTPDFGIMADLVR